jgi:FtsP/CotA-like multicopper oxidase with cupredoxin domain
MGRFGNHYLINGQENYHLKIKAGQVTRLYITNSANVRPFNIQFVSLSEGEGQGEDISMKLV